jgi:hypothetical protein
MENIQQSFQAQSALQKQQLDAEQNVNAGYMLQNQQIAQAALVEQINPSRTLREIKLTLQGKEEDTLGNLNEVGEPLMNDKGVGNTILIAKSVINQNTIMSSLNDKEIGSLIIQLGDDIADDLVLNWKEYGIKDKIKLDIIMDTILNPSFMALKRARQGGERRFLGTTTVENISTAPRMPQAKKEGFWSRFKL